MRQRRLGTTERHLAGRRHVPGKTPGSRLSVTRCVRMWRTLASAVDGSSLHILTRAARARGVSLSLLACVAAHLVDGSRAVDVVDGWAQMADGHTAKAVCCHSADAGCLSRLRQIVQTRAVGFIRRATTSVARWALAKPHALPRALNVSEGIAICTRTRSNA
jgi:hypothetical protein